MLHSDVFQSFLILVVTLTVVSTILARVRVPTVVGFILSGILIGPSGFDLIRSIPVVESITELGVVFLMFSLGLEVSVESLRKMLRPLVSIGFGQVALTIAGSAIAFPILFDVPFNKSFIIGLLLAMSSTAVVLKLLQESRETETPYGRVSVMVLLAQDIAVLPLMMAVPLLAGADSAQGIAFGWLSAIKFLGFLLGCYLLARFVIPRLFSEVARAGSRELFFFLMLSTVLCIGFVAEWVGLSLSLGAFVAGVLISESPYNKQALAEFTTLREAFLAIFFASVGMLLNLNFVQNHLAELGILIVILFFLKSVVIYTIARWNRFTHGTALAASLVLAQIGEFSFIIAAESKRLKILDDNEFQLFLALAVLSLLLTPWLFRFGAKTCSHHRWPELLKALQMGPATQEYKRVHAADVVEGNAGLARPALVIGLGHAGEHTLRELQSNGIPCSGLDYNISHINRLSEKGFSVRFGDATRPEVLEACGIEKAFLVVICVTGKQMVSQILSTVRRIQPHVRVIIRVQFLLDVNELRASAHDHIVVAEAESAQIVASKALREYGVETQAFSEV